MNEKIRRITDQISKLEAELITATEAMENRIGYQIKGKRVAFEQSFKEAHRRVKLGVFRWFLTVRPQNYLTMPVIYGMCVPMVFFDLCVTLYQLICFPVYRIARVKHADYMLFDHGQLQYLNVIEKVHCMYCTYAVGLLGYAQEITARTEQYFCPIKHARKVLGAHSRYKHFLEYGEADDFHGKLEKFRGELASEADDGKQSRR